jgi:fatty acid desaturase
MATIAPSTALCIRRIREQLPADAFRPAHRRLWHVPVHGTIVVAGYVMIRSWPALGPMAAVLIGHSLACLAFVAHEISHNAVVRHRGVKRSVEFVALGINMVPPTMWNRLHNDAHHSHANTVDDPDRPYLEDERSAATAAYSLLTMPTREGVRANVLVFAHFVTYLSRHITAVFYPGDAKPGLLTSKPRYQPGERSAILCELALMLGLQYGVWVIAGRSWLNYLWASPVALCVASAVIVSYVFTNHFLNPISHELDPLAGTTSVRVPRVFDILHSHFSFHTEHHLFPSLNPDYYPLVSRALKTDAPEVYRQIEFSDAWRALWLQPRFRTMATGPKNSAGL